MFEFTTQTVFNTIKKDTLVKGQKPAKGANVLVGGTDLKPELRIGNLRFNKDDVLDIQVKNHTVENLAKVEFDLDKVKTLVTADSKDVFAGSYRIVLYLGLSMNSQDSFYANDFVYKGKPLYVEFPVNSESESTETIAKRIVKIANKYFLFMAQDQIMNVTAEDGKITFEAVNGYQIIKKAILQKYDPNANQIDCCNNNGDFIDIVTGVPVTWTADETTGEVTVGDQTLDVDGLRDLEDNEVAIEPGIEAFCDYNWLIHNLRLPTLANTYYWSVTKNEMPVVGGEYTQFIIRLCKERDGIAGEVVGQRATSVTTHVLYVLDQGNNVSDVKTELAKLVDSFKTDADDVLSDPFASVSETSETSEEQNH